MPGSTDRYLDALERRAKKSKDPGGHKWKGPLPRGWTDESREKFWSSLTAGAPKHKVTECIKKMTGKVSDAGAFCGALADRVLGKGWRTEAAKERREKKAALRFSPDERRGFGRMARSCSDAQRSDVPWDEADRVAAAVHFAGQRFARRPGARQEAALLRAKLGLAQPLRTRRDYGEPDDEGQHSRMPGDEMPEQDRARLDRRASDEWITREEMERLCPPCAERMRRAGLRRVRASVVRRMLEASGR